METTRPQPVTSGIDKHALLTKYRAERDKRLRPTATTSTPHRRAARALPRRPLHAQPRARAADRPPHRRLRRRRLRGPAGRGRLARPGSRTSASSRRAATSADLVLEPLPGRPVRHGLDGLHAAARGDRPHADREVRARARRSSSTAAHRQAVRPLRRRPVPHRGHRARVGRASAALDRHAPTAATASPRSSSAWAPARCTCPKLPGIPGIETSRATRSTPAAGTTTTPAGTRTARRMDRLADKRVAIIGTGATAVQCVPHLARGLPGALRLPAHPVVGRRARQPADRPGLVRRRSPRRAGSSAGWRTSPPTRPAAIADEDLVMDGWTDISQPHPRRRSRTLPGDERTPETMLAAYEDSDFEKMEEIRARVDADRRGPRRRPAAEGLVPPAVQAAVLPRRVPAGLQRARRHLVDTDGQGVERITETGVVAAGDEYEVDCIIYASGFEVGTALRAPGRLRVDRPGRARPVRVLGRGDAHPARHPRPRLPERLHRPADPGREPDLERPAQPRPSPRQTIAAVVRTRRRRPASSEVEPTAGGRGAWVELSSPARAVLGDADCTPGYYNNEGLTRRTAARTARRLSARRRGLLRVHRRLAARRHLRGPHVRANPQSVFGLGSPETGCAAPPGARATDAAARAALTRPGTLVTRSRTRRTIPAIGGDPSDDRRTVIRWGCECPDWVRRAGLAGLRGRRRGCSSSRSPSTPPGVVWRSVLPARKMILTWARTIGLASHHDQFGFAWPGPAEQGGAGHPHPGQHLVARVKAAAQRLDYLVAGDFLGNRNGGHFLSFRLCATLLCATPAAAAGGRTARRRPVVHERLPRAGGHPLGAVGLSVANLLACRSRPRPRDWRALPAGR